MIVVAVAMIVFFVFYELKFPYAIIPAAILRNKRIIFSLLSALFCLALMMTVAFQLPFALQGYRCYTALKAGAITLVAPVM